MSLLTVSKGWINDSAGSAALTTACKGWIWWLPEIEPSTVWTEVLRGLSIITMALGLDPKSEFMQLIAGDTPMEEVENIEGDSRIKQTIEATTPLLEDD